jgi:hypothetical protein
MAREQLPSSVSDSGGNKNPRWVRINNDNVALAVPLLSLVVRESFIEAHGSVAN